MAYLLPHQRELFRTVAASDAPDAIRTEAQTYADMDIDSVIDECAWLDMSQAIDAAKWPGKRELTRELNRLTRHGG